MSVIASLKHGVAAAALLVAGVASAQTLQLNFNGVVTSLTFLAGTSVGDTLSGSMSFEAGAFVANAGDGTTFERATYDTMAPLSHAEITFQHGAVIETGTHGSVHETTVSLERGYPLPSPGTNLYALSSHDPSGPDNPTFTDVSLSIADFLGPASHIFSTPTSDLSLLQSVDWLAAGATTIGQFASGNSNGEFRLTSIDVVTVSAVPEPDTLALIAGGLGIVAWTARRRRCKISHR